MGKKNYTYCTVQATSAKFNEPAAEGKKPSVEVSLKVTACDDPSRVGSVFTEFMSLSGGAVEYTMRNLRALGWTCDDITELEGVGSIQAKGGIYLDTYDGKTREKCNVFEAKPELTASAKKTFASQFKAAAKSAKPVKITDANAALAPEDLPIQRQANGLEAGEEEECPC